MRAQLIIEAPFQRALLEREGLLLVPDGVYGLPETIIERRARARSAATFQANIEGLGFGFTKAEFKRLADLPTDTQALLYTQAWPVLMELAGAHRSWKPMYPNFPKQVMDAGDAELFVNAIVHYAGDVLGFRYLPDYPEEKRPKLSEKTLKLRPVHLAQKHEARAALAQWLSSTVAWSPAQVEAVRAGLDWARAGGVLDEVTAAAAWPNRENKAVVAAWHLKNNPKGGLALFDPMSPLDVLRTATALSGGDVSLAEPPRFKSFPRTQRRALMAALERGIPATATAEEDVFNRREQFLRLGERLHPGEMAKDYPLAGALFDAVRNRKAPVSLMGRLDAVLGKEPTDKTVAEVCAMFQERPGALARQLHRILRWTQERGQMLDVVMAFDGVADRCATGLLLTIAHHFEHQHERQCRAVLPKGALARIQLTDNVPAAIDQKVAQAVREAAEDALVRRFSKLAPLGACHVDPALDQVPTPFAVRSASKALHTVPRGAKLPIQVEGTTRLFLWWSETDPAGKLPATDRIDIDLSCVVLDKDFKVVSTCSYYDLRGPGLTHSGDITSAPKGACEFVDIEHAKLPKGSRYVVMSINSFTQQSYADVPECFAGWMERAKPRQGEIFEPRTVANRFDLTCDSKAVMPMMVDLEKGHVVWLDMPYVNDQVYLNNVLTQEHKLRRILEGYEHLSRPTMGRLFRLHARARGELVSNKKQAQTLFTLAPQHDKTGVCAYALEEITSQWMAEDTAPAPDKKPGRKPA